MWTAWGKRKLRPVVGRVNRYQSFTFPETAAIEASASDRVAMRERNVPPKGTDGDSEPITLKGEFQGDSHSLRNDIERRFQALFGLDSAPSARDWALFGYTTWLVVLLLGLVTAVLLSRSEPDATLTWPLVALAVSACLAELQSVRLNSRASVSVSSLPIVLAAVIYGPLAAIVVSAASLLCDFRAPYGRWLTWTSSRSIAAGCAGVVAFEIDRTGAHGFGPVVAAVACATVVEQFGDLALGSVAARLRGMTVREIAKVSSAAFVALPLYIPMTALLVYACREVSTWSVVLFLFPAFAAQKFFLLYREQRATSEELTAAFERQERTNLSFATALVATLDARDRYTAGHSAAVAVYARDIAERLGLSESDQRLAHLAGLVHDIGKIGLPPGLLEKVGPLTLDERRQMEAHPVIGERILRNVEGYEEIAGVVRYHHERLDGQGYPDGLSVGEIPLLARVLAVADAYDAMTSDRPYRDAMSSDLARLRLAQGVGTQFDTGVVAAFEAILVGAAADYPVRETRVPAVASDRLGEPATASITRLRVVGS
jgi:putative nucleotidyltransferase with HDIG domain